MKIRFCEFCGNVLRDEPDNCDVCGSHLIQQIEEDQFNDPSCPWPFEPVLDLCLKIQDRPRHLRFSGTHSVYHLWAGLHWVYEGMSLYFRVRKDEVELAEFSGCEPLPGYRVLEAQDLITWKHSRFSCYTFTKADPELEAESDALEMTYQGSFEITDCPTRELGHVLGWLVATKPYPRTDDDWTYEI